MDKGFKQGREVFDLVARVAVSLFLKKPSIDLCTGSDEKERESQF